jgi:hypothetical protein
MFTLPLPTLSLALLLAIEPSMGQTPPGFEPSTAVSLGVAFDNDTTLQYPGMGMFSQGTCLACVGIGLYQC